MVSTIVNNRQGRPLKKLIASSMTAGLMGFSLVACSSSDSAGSGTLLDSIESGNVTVAVKFDQPGMGLKNPDGSMTGSGVEITNYVINHIAEENGWDTPEITYREAPAAQRENLIANGEVAMIEGGYSITAERMERVNFAGPYLITHQALLVRSDAENPINELADLDGRILCSTSGSTPAQRTKEALPTVQLQEYDTNSSCVEALGQGNVDALTSDAAILAGYAKEYPDEFKVVEMKKDDGSYFSDEYYGIGLAKDDTEGTEAINAALKELIDSGEWQKIIDSYYGDAGSINPGTPGDLSFTEKD